MKSKRCSHNLQSDQQGSLPADLCTYHTHYVKNHRSAVLRRNKNMAVEVGTVPLYYILVIRNFIQGTELSVVVVIFLLRSF